VVGAGVIALAEQDGHELRAGLEDEGLRDYLNAEASSCGIT